MRWFVGAFLILNGLGTPMSLATVFGPGLATALSLFLLVAHLASALTLCLAWGIPAFLRFQRQRRKAVANG